MAVLISSNEVCDKLGIKLNHLYQLKYRKQLVPMERQGKKYFYNDEEVDAFKVKRDAKNNKVQP